MSHLSVSVLLLLAAVIGVVSFRLISVDGQAIPNTATSHLWSISPEEQQFSIPLIQSEEEKQDIRDLAEIEAYPTIWTMTQINPGAPWSVRIQPELIYMHEFSPFPSSPTWLMLYEGALYHPGPPHLENDVWASSDDGKSWILIAGNACGWNATGDCAISYWGPSPITYTRRGAADSCGFYGLGGYNASGSSYAINDVWSTNDGRTFIKETPYTAFSPGRWFSSCTIDNVNRIYTTGGLYADNNDNEVYINDVWASSIVGGTLRPWKKLPTPPWRPRAEHLLVSGITPLYNTDTLYVIGGFTNSTERNTFGAFNDVWASSNAGQSWTLITQEAPFQDRWGHGGFVTSGGALLVIGGAGYNPILGFVTIRDVWSSFDGGQHWTQCALPATIDQRTFIRTEQGMVLTDNEELVIASGYVFNPPGPRGNYQDVWKTEFSLGDTAGLKTLCRWTGGEEIQQIEQERQNKLRAYRQQRGTTQQGEE